MPLLGPMTINNFPHLMRFPTFLFLFTLLYFSLPAQDLAPKREMRAAWIATVKNIDWPSSPNLSTAQQQAELLEMLDTFKANGLNAVVFQVRPAGDAFYDSPIEPWSEWLTGKQGRAPAPYYDPLAFIIEACHDRAMELHAWFNPFRAALVRTSQIPQDYKHASTNHPEWMREYGDRTYFDPGIPEVQEFVTQVILDVVRRYDIDAVHFDDYFYPYRIPNQEFPDSLSYYYYGDRLPRDEWRRRNVDQFVERMHREIKVVKPWVKFGISPFGVWRNFDKDITGSATQAGQTSYDDLFADVRKWAAEGWMDYLAPQAYFSIGFGPVDYQELVDWWSRNSYGRHLYFGHSLYKINNNRDPNWADPNQIPYQISLNRQYREIRGSMFFSGKWFKMNPLGVSDSLQKGAYRHLAFPPQMRWLDREPPETPIRPKVKSAKQGLVVRWDTAALNEDVAYIAVYKFPKKEVGSRENPANMIAVVGKNQGEIIDPDTRFLKRYSYVFTTLDRLYNESDAAKTVTKRRWSWGKRKK